MFQKFNLAAFAAYLQYQQHESDVTMPKLVSERKKHCMEVMQHESLSSSLHVSDVEDDGTGNSVPDLDVVVVLMGRSSSTLMTVGFC